MSDEKKRSTSSDTEYQYTEEEIGQESPEPEKKPPLTLRSIKDKLVAKLPKRKKTRAILIFLVAIYIVYKFLSSGESPPPTPTPPVEKPASQTVSKPPPEIKPVKKEVTVETTTKSSSLAETKKESMAEQKSQMAELQASLDQMNQSIATLESSLLSLTGSVIGLSNKMTALEVMRQEGIMSLRRHRLPAYHLQSLVPQRAWLMSSRGKLITVKVGDILPGYGRIEIIDTEAGIISTSSGRVIYYGPYDS